MTVCLIVGHAIATIAHPSLRGCRLALCQRLDEHGRADGSPPVLAVDAHGAGLHQRVLMTTDGKAAQELVGDPLSPIRNTIIGLVDDMATEAVKN
ncbi:MAG: EutN/CcmL family microcompartment protein [Verrucomicrobiales bacterium]